MTSRLGRNPDGSEQTLAGVPALVVEHNPPNARLFSVLLVKEGCDVRIATSAEEAIDTLRTFRARLVVVDLVLPRMSGLLFVQQLKEEPSARDLVVVAVSALNGPTVEQLAREAGCADCLRMPIDVHAFAGTLAKCLAGHI